MTASNRGYKCELWSTTSHEWEWPRCRVRHVGTVLNFYESKKEEKGGWLSRSSQLPRRERKRSRMGVTTSTLRTMMFRRSTQRAHVQTGKLKWGDQGISWNASLVVQYELVLVVRFVSSPSSHKDKSKLLFLSNNLSKHKSMLPS
jgi:hypothetical protein